MLSLILGDVLESSCVVLLCKVGGKDNISEVWEKLMAFSFLDIYQHELQNKSQVQ